MKKIILVALLMIAVGTVGCGAKDLVKSKFLKLNHMHLEYVIDCLKSNTTQITHIKNYMLAALFNAPSTMSSYYQAEVNHNMYGT